MDPQQFLTELDADLRSVIGELLATATSATESTATDDSGRVKVTLHPDRTLAQVVIAPDWETEIESSALAAVILEVAGRAQQVTMVEGDAPAAAVDVDPEEIEAARDELLRGATAELMEPISAAELQRQIDDLPAMLDRLNAQLDVAIEKTARLGETDLPTEDAVEDDEMAGETVTSKNGMVSVRVLQGHLGDVRIKESWLQGRSGIAVSQCFEEIMQRIAGNTTDEELR